MSGEVDLPLFETCTYESYSADSRILVCKDVGTYTQSKFAALGPPGCDSRHVEHPALLQTKRDCAASH